VKIYLASNSKGRAEVLTRAHINFEIIPTDVDETRIMNDSHLSVSEKVQRLSLLKTQAGTKTLSQAQLSQAFVIGGDTLFEINNELWGKPIDVDQARARLGQMRNRTGTIWTGLTLFHNNQIITKLSTAQIKLASYSDVEIERYLNTGEPMIAAGNFAIEGYGGPFIQSIRGDYFAIIGLSLVDLNDALHNLGFSVSDFWT
jgi:septum formation protein